MYSRGYVHSTEMCRVNSDGTYNDLEESGMMVVPVVSLKNDIQLELTAVEIATGTATTTATATETAKEYIWTIK